MLNNTTCKTTYTIQDGVSSYPIGFEFIAPEHIAITIDGASGILGIDYAIIDGNVIIEGSHIGKTLVISRTTPFTQESDYQVGRINPEQIEHDFDRSVMRDQEISSQLNDLTVDVAQAESLANAAIETANEAATAANQATATANTALTASGAANRKADEAKATATQASKDAVDAMADATSAANKADAADMTATTAMEIAAEAVTLAQSVYSKKEVDDKITVINADIDANADAIQKTRADFIEADSDIHNILNNHAGELTTLHNDVDDLGDQVSGIESKIPESASDTNQLATKADLEGLGGGDFLPLSGGTMTGDLLLDVGESPTTVGATRALGFTGTVDGVRHTCWFSYMPQIDRLDVSNVHFYNIGHITPHGNGEKDFGSSYNKFNTVYTNKISSASSKAITIPALSGTMARIEDIDAIGGDGTAGQVLTKTDDGMAWQDASGGGGDYLPLAGGEMAGNIFMPATSEFATYNIKFAVPSKPNDSKYFYKLAYDGSGSDDGFGIQVQRGVGNAARYFFTLKSFCAMDWYSGGKIDLGNTAKPWKTIYVTAMNNGADLAVPTEGGTLARIEDIDAVVGDISTALTAILGE